jgi:hypothetical protein
MRMLSKNKNLSPARRAQLEREQQDWLVLADQRRTWRGVQAEEQATPLRAVVN